MDLVESPNHRAMPSARATHATHRARILGLGLSAGIAIALSGCSRTAPGFDNFEVVDADYATVAVIANHNWGSSPLARKALSDGKLTQGEYRGIMDKFDADRAADEAQAKADALRRWGRTMPKSVRTRA
jgi:hypothetical protein